MKLSTDFTNAKAGSGVWCEEYCYGIVSDLMALGRIEITFIKNDSNYYIYVDASGIAENGVQVYLLPKTPLEQIIIEYWINLYKDGEAVNWPSKEEADCHTYDRLGEAEHVVKKYFKED